MPKIKLVKRTYLGEGYFHYFVHNTTGDVVKVESGKDEYLRLGIKGGSQFNPTLADHTWHHSEGGTVKVDTPDFELSLKEYAEVGDQVYVKYDLGDGKVGQTYFPKTDVVNDEIDSTKLTKK